MRIKLLHRSAAMVLSLLLMPMISAAQIVKLAQEPTQETKQTAPVNQTTVAPRIGVDESQPLALTLFDAVKMALENNREIEVERINVQQSEYDLFAARGSRDI